jgi:hypothetical protein
MDKAKKDINRGVKLQIIFGFRLEMLLSLAAMGYFFKIIFSLTNAHQMKDIFCAMNVELPEVTKLYLGLSAFLSTWGIVPVMLVILGLLGWGAFWFWMIKKIDVMGHEKRMKYQIGISFFSLVSIMILSSINTHVLAAVILPVFKLVTGG